MTLSDELTTCYAHCRRIARGASSSFPRFFRLLPADKRRGMYALYAFFRHTDDLGDDESQPLESRRQRLDQWEVRWHAAFAGDAAGDAVGDAAGAIADEPLADTDTNLWLPAVADTARRFSVPASTFQAVIRGCRQDLDKANYASFSELTDYCHLVATSVGIACMHVWGFDQTEGANERASAAGIAFQLTNILRDIAEDQRRGRVYLPQDEWSSFGCTAAGLLSGTATESAERWFQFQIERAQSYFDDARGLVPYLSADGKRIFRLMHGCYAALLAQVARQGIAGIGRRARLSRLQLLAIVARELCLARE